MVADADRFRPRDPSPSSVSEQTPPTAPSPDGASARGTLPASGQQQPQPARSQSLYGRPQYGSPQLQSRPSRPYAPPPYAVPPHFAAPATTGRDAPLIHPAAAQADSRTTYGVPVYQAPVYAYAPQPQRGLSITALVLGLCSVIFAWTLVVVPLIGIVFGILALRREPAGRAMAVTGLITSGLGLIWILLFYVLPLIGVVGALFLSMGFV